MIAAKLRHLVTIQQVTETPTGTGARSSSWSTFATVRAERLDLSGREFFQAAAVNDETTVKFRIRYRSGIVPKMRLVHGSETFDITAALDPQGMRRELLLMCRKL